MQKRSSLSGLSYLPALEPPTVILVCAISFDRDFRAELEEDAGHRAAQTSFDIGHKIGTTVTYGSLLERDEGSYIEFCPGDGVFPPR